MREAKHHNRTDIVTRSKQAYHIPRPPKNANHEVISLTIMSTPLAMHVCRDIAEPGTANAAKRTERIAKR